MQTEFVIETRGPGLTEFTRDVARWLEGAGDGLLTLMVRHTSASLLIQENADPEVRTDLVAWLDRLVPPADDPSMAYLRHTYEGPDDMRLGTWQGIYLVEHRRAPHRRTVAALFQPTR